MKSLVKQAQAILASLGHNISLGHCYELFSRLQGYPSHNHNVNKTPFVFTEKGLVTLQKEVIAESYEKFRETEVKNPQEEKISLSEEEIEKEFQKDLAFVGVRNNTIDHMHDLREDLFLPVPINEINKIYLDTIGIKDSDIKFPISKESFASSQHYEIEKQKYFDAKKQEYKNKLIYLDIVT